MKAIISNTFQSVDFSFPISLSETILLENGESKNFECCISPNPIGAPMIVIKNSPPKIKVYNAVIKPKKGKCQRILPNVLISFF